ncbi:MAG: hypothetical protein JSS10_06185 [Verrucomicrobia bacterium]|nr:hypothetical protein [Verrucomicrobiota bacterium]
MIKATPDPTAGLAHGMAAMAITPKPAAKPPAAAAPEVKFGLHFLKVVKGVHEDDIHCIARLTDGTFVTGSKDGALKKWNLNGELVRVIDDPALIDYTKWVTALARFNDTHWICGKRDGTAILWNNEGTAFTQLNTQHAPFPKGGAPLCKQRNVHRINCLASFEQWTKKPLFFAGWATQFTLHDAHSQKRLRYTYTSNNDWVYAIQPLAHDSLLVVTGCRLDLWNLRPGTFDWEWKDELIVEDKSLKQRPYISAITPLQENAGKYGVAVFDGSVRIYDLTVKKEIFKGQEHINRVWTVENIAPHCFASCGDDGFVKLWDLRLTPKSTVSLKGNIYEKSRVSVLLRINDNQLMGASCPDNVKYSQTKAQFTYWDIRR